MNDSPAISDKIKDLREIIGFLELHRKNSDPDTSRIYGRAIDKLKESISLLHEQRKIDEAWHEALVHVLNEKGESDLSTTE